MAVSRVTAVGAALLLLLRDNSSERQRPALDPFDVLAPALPSGGNAIRAEPLDVCLPFACLCHRHGHSPPPGGARAGASATSSGRALRSGANGHGRPAAAQLRRIGEL